MPISENIHIQSLIHAVEKRFEKKIVYSKDCWALSNSIQKQTNRYLSETTLKRFWNLVKSKFNPSRYTLDTLAIYIGCEGWNDFITKIGGKPTINFEDILWYKIKDKADAITSYNVDAIKNRMGIPYENAIKRNFAEKSIETFLNSDKRATAFIAPGGYGKSTIIMKLIEKFFTGHKALYPNDIIWLIDGSILENLFTEEFDVEEYIKWLLGMKLSQSLNKYFHQHPDHRKGRLILLIDGLNEISYRIEKNTVFTENLLKIVNLYDDAPWFKFIFTCRTSIWNFIAQQINKLPHTKDKWFGVKFEGNYSDLSNVPLLDKDEISEILRKCNLSQKLEEAEISNPSVIDIINNPYFLHLFISCFKEEKDVSDINLLNKFTYEAILNGMFGEEKYAMIEILLKQTRMGLDGDSISKNILEELIKTNPIAYNELISYGILYEYKVRDKYLSISTRVKFTHDILFEFFLTNVWLKENKLEYSLLEELTDYYKNTIELQFNIIIWIIKFAFKESNIELLENIYSFLNKHFIGIPNSFQFFTHVYEYINIIGCELRKYTKLREELIPRFATTFIGQSLYFEKFIDIDFINLHFSDNINFYLKNKHTKEAKIYGNCIKFWKHFFSNDKEGCLKQHEILDTLKLTPDLQPFHVSIYIHYKILFENYLLGKISNSLLKNVFEIEKNLFRKEAERIFYFPYYQFALVDAFNLCDQHKATIRFVETILSDFEISEKLKETRSYKFLMIFYAYALLKSEMKNEAYIIFEKIQLNNLAVNSKYYWSIRYLLIKTEFLISECKLNMALDNIQKLKSLTQMLKFHFFELKVNKMEIAIKNHSSTTV